MTSNSFAAASSSPFAPSPALSTTALAGLTTLQIGGVSAAQIGQLSSTQFNMLAANVVGQFDTAQSAKLLDEAGWGVIWRTGGYTRSKAVAAISMPL